jgi:GxxExxY protein
LGHELRKTGLLVAQQQGITVIYDGFVVGDYNVDILVEGTIIIELKAIKALDNAQTATGLHLCLLLNFGKPRLETPAHGPRSLKPLGISACIGG